MLDHLLPRRLRWSPLRPYPRRRPAAAFLVRTASLDMDVALAAYFMAEQATRNESMGAASAPPTWRGDRISTPLTDETPPRRTHRTLAAYFVPTGWQPSGGQITLCLLRSPRSSTGLRPISEHSRVRPIKGGPAFHSTRPATVYEQRASPEAARAYA